MKKTLRYIFRFIIWSLAVLIACAILYLLVAVVGSLIPVRESVTIGAGDTVTIFLKSNGVHADVVCPVKNETYDWSQKIDPGLTRTSSVACDYIAFGWGDSAFFRETRTWGDLRLGPATEALFWPGKAAMHVTFSGRPQEGDRCVKLIMNSSDYRAICNYIDASMLTDASGHYLLIPDAGYSYDDLFFEAKGHYHIFYTCNTWTNGLLKKGHRRACLWTPFVQGIFYHYQ